MKNILLSLSQRVSRTLQKLQDRFRRARPGSVLILVVALLVLLALMGTAYVATARLDRQAAGPMRDRDALDQEARAIADELAAKYSDAIAKDRQRVTGAIGEIDPVTKAQATSGFWMDSGDPMLLTDPTTGNWVSLPNPWPQGPTPAWRFVSRRDPTDPPLDSTGNSFSFVNIYDPQNRGSGILYGDRVSKQNPPQDYYWFVPWDLAIHYDRAQSPLIDAALDGRTRVFPAFLRLKYDPKNKIFVVDPIPNRNPQGIPVILATDPTACGVASAPMQPLNTPPMDGVFWYYGVQVVDNAAKLNANVHWSRQADLDPNYGTLGNCRNFFPPDVDLLGFLTQQYGGNNLTTSSTEIYNLATQWLDNLASPNFPGLTQPYDDLGNKRSDFKYATPSGAVSLSEALWRGLGSRLANPGLFDDAGNASARFRFGIQNQRPFDRPDTNALAYRHGMVNPDASPSALEQIFIGNPSGIPPRLAAPPGNDSIYGSALNNTTYPDDKFRFVTPRDVVYWWDYNYGFEGLTDNGTLWQQQYQKFPAAYTTGGKYGIAGNFGLTTDGVNHYFRSPRELLTANNPVQNLSPSVNLNNMFKYIYPKGGFQTGNAWQGSAVMNAYGAAGFVPKTSLNTAQFEDLWRGYLNVMAENDTFLTRSPAAETPFHVPGDYVTFDDDKMFKSPLRATDGTGDPTAPPTGPPPKPWQPSGQMSWNPPSNTWSVRFDKYNTLLLRAAIAAVNTIDIRDADGMNGNDKIGNVTSRNITLEATVGTQGKKLVQVTVYGTEAQLFITEIYANTDTIHKGDKDDFPGSQTQANVGGFVAVELFNPYPFALDISDYKIGVICRDPNKANGKPGAMKLRFVGKNGTIVPGSGGRMVPAGTSVVLSNYDSTGPNRANYVPASVAFQKKSVVPTQWCKVEGLEEVFDGAARGDGGEMVLLRGHQHGTLSAQAKDFTYNETLAQDMVPADCYDFTGLSIANKTQAYDWHYVRAKNKSAGTADLNWKCVFPGPYDPSKRPRFTSTQVSPVWEPTGKADDTWKGTGDPKYPISLGWDADDQQPCFTINFPGIPLNAFSWPAPFKPTASNNSFPYGGFARVGDIMQVPFIGAYRVIDPNAQGAKKNQGNGGYTFDTLVEFNPVTMDLMFAADNDKTNDAQEHLGRFCPMPQDYDPNGWYSTDGNPPRPKNPQVSANNNTPVPVWSGYRWTTRATEAFTVVSNPNDDYLPNTDPSPIINPQTGQHGPDPQTGLWKYPPANPNNPNLNPQPVINAPLAAGAQPNNGFEDGVPVEGLININIASWRVLAALEMIPKSQDTAYASGGLNPTGKLTYNQVLAKAIVHYRDVDDGTVTSPTYPAYIPHPHGPFHSLMELNAVFDPATPNNTFQNALGILGTGTPFNPKRGAEWGNYAQYAQTPTATQDQDFISQHIMVNRISNLVTTRSDAFTVYIVVQGWKNIGTPYPELVVQKRTAFLVDRSQVNSTTTVSNVRTYPIPTK